MCLSPHKYPGSTGSEAAGRKTESICLSIITTIQSRSTRLKNGCCLHHSCYYNDLPIPFWFLIFDEVPLSPQLDKPTTIFIMDGGSRERVIIKLHSINLLYACDKGVKLSLCFVSCAQIQSRNDCRNIIFRIQIICLCTPFKVKPINRRTFHEEVQRRDLDRWWSAIVISLFWPTKGTSCGWSILQRSLSNSLLMSFRSDDQILDNVLFVNSTLLGGRDHPVWSLDDDHL